MHACFGSFEVRVGTRSRSLYTARKDDVNAICAGIGAGRDTFSLGRSSVDCGTELVLHERSFTA